MSLKAARPPSRPDIGVIALVPDRWGPVWQVRHHVISRLAEHFHVAWVDPSIPWRRILTSEFRRKPGLDFSWEAASQLLIRRPEWWLPAFRRPARLAAATFRHRIRRAHRELSERGCVKFVLSLWRPEFQPAIEAVSFDAVCYHIDDEYSFSTEEKPIDPAEARLIASVDRLFVHSPGLMEKKGSLSPRAVFIPNGVDFRAYSSLAPEPADITAISRPRIGYTGYLKNQLDWQMIETLATRAPAWHFVFVGPVAPHQETHHAIAALSQRPNVHFLGPKSVRELAVYPQHFDVCVMPYRVDAYTGFIYPMKLHEYLASGTPVVGSRIRTLESFSGVIKLASTPEGWFRSISAALEPDERFVSSVRRRQHVAERHDWDQLVDRISQEVCVALGLSSDLDSSAVHPLAGVTSSHRLPDTAVE